MDQGSEAKHAAEEWTMRSHQYEIVVLLHAISLGFITTAKTEVPSCKNPYSSFDVEQALTLKSYRTEIVEDVHSGCWVVIQVVANRSRELRDLTAVRSRPIIGCTTQVEPRADDAHITHWSNPDFVVTPAIGIHHAKVTEPQIGGGIEVGNVSLVPECEASRKRRIAIPGSLRVFAEEFVFAVFCPVRVSHGEAKLVAKIEVARKRDDRTGISVRRKTRFA